MMDPSYCPASPSSAVLLLFNPTAGSAPALSRSYAVPSGDRA